MSSIINLFVLICALIVLISKPSFEQAPCPVEEDPVQLAECAQLDVQAIIQAARGNLKLFCNLAERYMECFKTKTRNCIGGWVAEGGLTELQNLAQWCCVNPGVQEPDECPLHRNLKCFSGDGHVSMATGETKVLRDLRPGDRVLVMNSEQQIVEDEVMLMLDSQPNRPALFYSIETETGHRLSLTGNHFIAVNHNDRFLPANQIKSRDIVFIHHHGQLQPVTVRNVTEEYKVGYFTPMTGQGTLIVNGMAASCYSNVISHDLAHHILAPLRWWYRFAKWFSIEQPFEYSPDGGIHWIPKTMLQITEKYLPSVLTTNSLQDGKLLHFVKDLHSEKLHRDFHNPPSPTQQTSTTPISSNDGGDSKSKYIPRTPSADSADSSSNSAHQFSKTSPPESVFIRLSPNRARYSFRDEL